MTTIFISYSRKDSDVVYVIADQLRTRNYTVWTDVSGIPGGSIWHAEIEQAIMNADVILVMMSPASRESLWVQKEILFALDLEKTIIPVIIEKSRLIFALYHLQPVDYTTSDESAFTRLLAALPKPDVSTNPLALNINPTTVKSPQRLKGLSLHAFRRELLERQTDDVQE